MWWRVLLLVMLCGSADASELRVVNEAGRDDAWVELIRSRVPQWQKEIAELARNFAPVTAPEVVRIVLRSGGKRDAFVIDPSTIGFDVALLHSLYGEAANNVERIDRFFRHEYVHLLQKAWLAKHPYKADTPLRVALLGIWTEGLGNYYSLSSRWRNDSSTAKETLERLAPRFVANLHALACGTGDADRLLTELSEGKFEEKWAALPAALWLERESRASDDALRRFVLAGPDGVRAFAERNLPELLKPLPSNTSPCGSSPSAPPPPAAPSR